MATSDAPDEFGVRFGTAIVNFMDEIFIDNPVRQDMRDCTKKVLDLIENVQKEMGLSYVMLYNGSQSDGVLNRSDVDVMYCYNDFIVVEEPSQIPETYDGGVLLIDYKPCHPGFTRLRLHRPTPDLRCFDLFSEMGGQYYLNKDKYLKYTSKTYPKVNEIHGPSFNAKPDLITGRTDLDHVTCLKCIFWPSWFRDFSHVKCKMADPEEVFDHFHVVCLAHKDSMRPDLEFRLSFSVAEKQMAQNWSVPQMKFFLFCKKVIKEFMTIDGLSQGVDPSIIGEELLDSKSLCSYHIKTSCYFFFEFFDAEIFECEDYYSIFRNQFLPYLKDDLQRRHLQHYFVLPHNIFEGLSEKDFRIYLAMMQQNFDHLPKTAKHFKKNIRTLEKHLSDLINTRLITIHHIRTTVERLLTVSSYLFAEHGNFTSQTFADVTERLTSSATRELTSNDLFIEEMKIRCLAVLHMYEGLSKQEGDEERIVLLSQAEEEFKATVSLTHSPNPDYGVCGFAYLALFYYLTIQYQKCRECCCLCCIQYMSQPKAFYMAQTDSIVLPSQNDRGQWPDAGPSFLQGTPLKLLFGLHENTVEPVQLDPVVLCKCLFQFVSRGGVDALMLETTPSYESYFDKATRLEDITSLLSQTNRVASLLLLRIANSTILPDQNSLLDDLFKEVRQHQGTNAFESLMRMFEENKEEQVKLALSFLFPHLVGALGADSDFDSDSNSDSNSDVAGGNCGSDINEGDALYGYNDSDSYHDGDKGCVDDQNIFDDDAADIDDAGENDQANDGVYGFANENAVEEEADDDTTDDCCKDIGAGDVSLAVGNLHYSFDQIAIDSETDSDGENLSKKTKTVNLLILETLEIRRKFIEFVINKNILEFFLLMNCEQMLESPINVVLYNDYLNVLSITGSLKCSSEYANNKEVDEPSPPVCQRLSDQLTGVLTMLNNKLKVKRETDPRCFQAAIDTRAVEAEMYEIVSTLEKIEENKHDSF